MGIPTDFQEQDRHSDGFPGTQLAFRRIIPRIHHSGSCKSIRTQSCSESSAFRWIIDMIHHFQILCWISGFPRLCVGNCCSFFTRPIPMDDSYDSSEWC